MTRLIRRVRGYVQHHGVAYTLVRSAEKFAERVLRTYDRAWQQMKTTEDELQRQRENPVPAGLISVVVPVYNTDPAMLMELIDSLLAQTYSDWEAVLFNDCSTKQVTLDALKAAGEKDPRIKVYHGEKNQGISGGSNSAVALARGEWIALLDHDDLLTPDALWRVAGVIRDRQPDLIYSDEDKITQNGAIHTDPHFKPDFCPDNLRSGNYFCHLMVIRKTLIQQAGGFRTAFNGSQDHDLALRCIELTDKVEHIPYVLYHWRTVGSSVSHQNLMRCVDAACRAVTEHMGRVGWPGTASFEMGNIRLRYDIKGSPSVGVYIFGESDEALYNAKTHFLQMDWPNYIIYLKKIDEAGRYAAMNRAAEEATEDVLLMLDASVAVKDPCFITELLMYAQRDDVGAVTPKLIDRRGRITHGGFAVGMDGMAQCRQEGLPHHANGWHLLMRTSHNVAAVSAACLMVRRDHFVPFDEDFRTGLGGVDWSLKMLRSGYRHVFTPHALAVCEDRKLLLSGVMRDRDDAFRYIKRWQVEPDPCYSHVYSREKADYRLAGKNKR